MRQALLLHPHSLNTNARSRFPQRKSYCCIVLSRYKLLLYYLLSTQKLLHITLLLASFLYSTTSTIMGFGKGNRKPAPSGAAPAVRLHLGNLSQARRAPSNLSQVGRPQFSLSQAGRAPSNVPSRPAAASSNANGQPSVKPKNSVADVHPSQVIEYLMKKGYLRTEQVLRQESAQVDKDGRPVFGRDEYGNEKYIRGFELLSSWIDSNLDIYKVGQS